MSRDDPNKNPRQNLEKHKGRTLKPSSQPGSFWTPLEKYYGGGNSNIFYFHPYLGKIPVFTNIFQMSWNHQLE